VITTEAHPELRGVNCYIHDRSVLIEKEELLAGSSINYAINIAMSIVWMDILPLLLIW